MYQINKIKGSSYNVRSKVSDNITLTGRISFVLLIEFCQLTLIDVSMDIVRTARRLCHLICLIFITSIH